MTPLDWVILSSLLMGVLVLIFGWFFLCSAKRRSRRNLKLGGDDSMNKENCEPTNGGQKSGGCMATFGNTKKEVVIDMAERCS